MPSDTGICPEAPLGCPSFSSVSMEPSTLIGTFAAACFSPYIMEIAHVGQFFIYSLSFWALLAIILRILWQTKKIFIRLWSIQIQSSMKNNIPKWMTLKRENLLISKKNSLNKRSMYNPINNDLTVWSPFIWCRMQRPTMLNQQIAEEKLCFSLDGNSLSLIGIFQNKTWLTLILEAYSLFLTQRIVEIFKIVKLSIKKWSSGVQY